MRVVATAGHVDHGKSALVRALTGTDPDRLAEERRRGLTIDLGYAWTTLPQAGVVEFVDVPGHIRFISNMLAGVAVVQAGLFCVDAREGWRTQTEEHLRILDLVNLGTGVIAITKADLVEPDRVDAVRTDISRRTVGAGFADAPVVACDAITGTGLGHLCEQLDRLLAAVPPAEDDSRPRLWVDRAFTIAGAGTVVTGGVTHGELHDDEPVVVVTDRGTSPARIRQIQAIGHRVHRATPGTRAALNLAGTARHAVGRGHAVIRPDTWHLTDRVDATINVLPSRRHDLTTRGAYRAYVGTAAHATRVRPLATTRLSPGDHGLVQLTFAHPLPLTPGDRYVLRDTGRDELVGGGQIVDLTPKTRQRPANGTTQSLSDNDWVHANELERRLGKQVEPVVGDWVVSPATLHLARRSLVERVSHSRPVGLEISHLDPREKAVLALLQAEGVLETVAGYAVLPTWRDELSHHPFVRRLHENPFSPPPPQPDDVPRHILRALVRRQLVVGRDGVYFAATALAAATAALAELSRLQPDGFTVSDAREALATTRKWAVPLLELLDQSGATLRRGDRRFLKPTSTSAVTER